MSEQQTAMPMDCPPAASSTQKVQAPTLQSGAAPSEAVCVDSKKHTLSFFIEVLKSIFSFPAMLGTCLVAKLFYELKGFPVDPDVWCHIRVGQDILRTHTWPTSDPYSWTVHGTPWIAYEWLSEIVLALVAKHGLQALAAYLFIMGGLVAVAIYYYASLCSGSAKAGFVAATLASIFAAGNFNLRPQMWGALFIAITLIVLEKFRRGQAKALWVLPPMFLIWVNAHGSWIIGIGIVLVTLLGGLFEFRLGDIEGVRWTEKQRVQLELVLLVTLAVLPITPYGTRLCTYPFLIATSIPQGVANVQEWLPMPFDIVWGKVFLAILLGAFALQVIYHFKFRAQQWVLAVGAIAMTVVHARFVIIFAPFFAPIMATMLSRWLSAYKREKDKFALNFALMAIAVFAMVWYFPKTSALEKALAQAYPVEAVKFLKANPVPGRMFNGYGFGGYLVGNLPEQKVFFDGREDLYEFEGVMNDLLHVSRLRPAAFAILKSYGIRVCILQRDEPLAVALNHQKDEWENIYQDQTSAIFVRRDATETVDPESGRFSAAKRSEHEPPAD